MFKGGYSSNFSGIKIILYSSKLAILIRYETDTDVPFISCFISDLIELNWMLLWCLQNPFYKKMIPIPIRSSLHNWRSEESCKGSTQRYCGYSSLDHCCNTYSVVNIMKGMTSFVIKSRYWISVYIVLNNICNIRIKVFSKRHF